ncbi:hypothetical protein RFI_26635, partial [Reticulomyxa filosa]
QESISNRTRERRLTQEYLDNFLEERFELDEMVQRGILKIPEEDLAEFLKGEENDGVGDIASERKQKAFADARKQLKVRLTQRMNPQELIDRGIVPYQGYWEDPVSCCCCCFFFFFFFLNHFLFVSSLETEEAYKQRQNQVEDTERHLQTFLAQRSKPKEMVYRGIVPDSDYFFKDKEKVEAAKKQNLQHKKKGLRQHLEVKKRLHDVNATAANDNTNESSFMIGTNLMEQLKSIAVRHHRFSSALEDLKDKLPFVEETSEVIAEDLLEKYEQASPIKFCREPNCTDPTHNHSKTKNERKQDNEEKKDTATNDRKRNSMELQLSGDHDTPIENLTQRIDFQALVDDGVVFAGHASEALTESAYLLQEKLRDSVIQLYCEQMGAFPLQLDLDYVVDNAFHKMQRQLQQQPSLLDNEDLLLQNTLTDIKINTIRPALLMEINRQDVEVHTTYIRIHIYNIYVYVFIYVLQRKKRKFVTKRLVRRLSLRSTPQQLQQRNVIPEGNYFDDPSSTVELKSIGRRLATEDLKLRMVNRSTPKELVQRGLTREEYLYLDKEQADQAVKLARKGTVHSLSRGLDSLFNPCYQLESRGVVPQGYFRQKVCLY